MQEFGHWECEEENMPTQNCNNRDKRYEQMGLECAWGSHHNEITRRSTGIATDRRRKELVRGWVRNVYNDYRATKYPQSVMNWAHEKLENPHGMLVLRWKFTLLSHVSCRRACSRMLSTSAGDIKNTFMHFLTVRNEHELAALEPDEIVAPEQQKCIPKGNWCVQKGRKSNIKSELQLLISVVVYLKGPVGHEAKVYNGQLDIDITVDFYVGVRGLERSGTTAGPTERVTVEPRQWLVVLFEFWNASLRVKAHFLNVLRDRW